MGALCKSMLLRFAGLFVFSVTTTEINKGVCSFDVAYNIL